MSVRLYIGNLPKEEIDRQDENHLTSQAKRPEPRLANHG